MTIVHLYQICYDERTASSIEPGFEMLDNRVNARPDWREYWPMRQYLLGNALAEEDFYGFFSPKFRVKTNLSAAEVLRFVEESDPDVDLVGFSPSIHSSAYYRNVFLAGEADHPGLASLTEKLLDRFGIDVSLDDMISDSTNSVFSNFFVARPRFWRSWLAINERIFSIAENAADPLSPLLNGESHYGPERDVPMKVFVMERVASLVAASEPGLVTRTFDPFASPKRIYKLPLAVTCDALKLAYRSQGHPQYLAMFELLSGMRRFINPVFRMGMGLPWGRLARLHDDLLARWSDRQR